MTSTIDVRPRGRPCTVCVLPAEERTRLELALADGATFLSVSNSTMGRVDRNAVRRHVVHGHLPDSIAEAVERLNSLDLTTLQHRIYEIAQRARETAQEAYSVGHHSTVLRAGDAEAKALGILAQLGINHEKDLEKAIAFRAVSRAVFISARTNRDVAEAVASVLDLTGQEHYALELREQFRDKAPETKQPESPDGR